MNFVPCFDEGGGRSSDVPSSPRRAGQSGRKVRSRDDVFGQLSHEAALRVVGWLRAKYPTSTAENVAADAGVSAATVRKWLDRASAPSFGAMLALIRAYGPEILAAAYDRAPAWLDRAAREADRDRTVAQLAVLQARLALLDGRASS